MTCEHLDQSGSLLQEVGLGGKLSHSSAIQSLLSAATSYYTNNLGGGRRLVNSLALPETHGWFVS